MHFHISWLGIWADHWSRVTQSEHEKCNIRSWKFNNSRYNPSINFKWFYRPLYTTWCKINDSYIAIIPVYVNVFLWFFRRKQTGQRGKPSTIVSLFRLYYFALQRNVLVLWSRVIVILLKKPISNALVSRWQQICCQRDTKISEGDVLGWETALEISHFPYKFPAPRPDIHLSENISAVDIISRNTSRL